MAAFQKRGDTWRVIVRKGAYKDKPLSATFDTKREAQAWALKIEADILTGKHQSPTRHTLREAIIKFRDEEAVNHKGANEDIVRLNKFLKTITFVDFVLTDIEPDHLIGWRNVRSKDTRLKNKAEQIYVTISPSTVRREMNLLRSVFETARVEWRWIKINPFMDVTRPEESKPRSRRFRDEELSRLMDRLGYDDEGPIETLSQQAMAVALIAVETAMRRSEIALLNWKQIDLVRKLIDLSDTKNDDDREVPLSPNAIQILKRITPNIGSNAVFTATPTYVSDRIGKAIKSLGIINLRLHDTRHEGATRLAKVLTNPADLAKVTGHKDIDTLIKVYYNPDMSDVADLIGDHHEKNKKLV